MTAILAFAAPAMGGAARVERLQALSGASPFPTCGVPGEDELEVHSEAEPQLAVNPRDARNIVASWQQDRFRHDGGAHSDVVSVTRDGGAHWRRVLVPQVSRCTGGEDERASDPWLSIGPDGRAYFATLTFSETPRSTFELAGPTAQRTLSSTDGGLTWSRPVTVVNAGEYDDREAITADPKRPGHAYLAWVRRLGALGENGVEFFSRTTDGGVTWSQPRQIYVPTEPGGPDPTLIEVLPDGTLLNLFFHLNASVLSPVPGTPVIPWKVMAMRSTDEGETWSQPLEIATAQPYPPTDPDSGRELRAFPVISTAVAPDGTAYVVWNEKPSRDAYDESKVWISRSTDGGRTWGRPLVVADVKGQAFLPNVAVTPDGTLGVTWDDTRRDKRGDGQFTTEVRFAHSHDRGRSWEQMPLAGPFDVLTAPRTGSAAAAGIFLGDYQGLEALPHGFAAVFAQAKPKATAGPSDIFFARISLRALAPRIRLSVRPRRAFAGRLTRFTFRATAVLRGRRRAVRRARIRFAGRRVRTNRRGRAALVVRFQRPGVKRARASRRGLRGAVVRVRVRQ